MTPNNTGGIPPDAARILSQVDAHVEAVARQSRADSDISELAYAIQNLVAALRKIHGDS